ncbi:MAG TPA: gas vesicle protein GvpG [Pirellulales bacterium]|nr:gas vesicle protein GvpG [Pirellulales bacterium]
MFLLDDILFSPVRGLMSVFRSLHDAAQEELAHEAESIRNQLSEMYVQLETGQVSEEEFDRCERELLERLEKLDARGGDYGAIQNSEQEDEHADGEEQGDENELDDRGG